MSILESSPGVMSADLLAKLRASPTTVPALAALALLIAWASDQGGFPLTHWAPGGLIVLGLLAIALACVRLKISEIPISVRIAVGCLAAYTALSFISIIWAAAPGEAWEGANRTLLYLLVFALFSLWRQRGVSAALLLGAWTIALIVLGAFVAVHIERAGGDLYRLIPEGRLVYPVGYVNANAAQWLMAFWPALLLSASGEVPWQLRGVFAAGAVLLADLALLSQSRGSVYATVVMLVLVFAFLKGRTRTFAALVPIAMAIGASTPAVLAVGDHLSGQQVRSATVHSAILAMFAAAVVVGLVVALGAAIERRSSISQASRDQIHRCIGVIAISTLVVILVGGALVAGNPIRRLESGWHTFKGGYAADSASGNRLISGLGSNRYDFYRVALDEFVAHPVLGVGADNFFEAYLAHGHSEETPRYPHSVELRALAETGILGGLIAIVGLGAALMACAGALGSKDQLARVVAAGALAGFAYWLVHGSVDWFWEFAGLGAPAFALLGIACALAPARTSWQFRARMAPTRAVVALILAVAGLAGAISFAAPWISQLEVQQAARIWVHSPKKAYETLNGAARLNPLSDQAYLVAGGIALRFGALTHADEEFSLALKRSPRDAYATLERGAIASNLGNRGSSLKLLKRAVELDPRDPLARQALAVARGGGRVSVQRLNRSILLNAQQFA
jgi:O-antigen ligase